MNTRKTQENTSSRLALVLGASGGVGGAVAETLLARGWAVRALVRHPARAQASWQGRPGALEWVEGDAMRGQDVVAAAKGTQAIVHAVNPPGYRDWEKLVLPMIDNTIAAAKSAGGARILLPGTIYNFDPDTTPVVREASPQRPRSRKGQIRVELERRLEQASHEAPVLIVRAGDFYGPKVRASWFAQAMLSNARPVKRLTLLAQDIGHSWAYLPDLAEAMVRLLEHPELRAFERVGFEGFWDRDGRAFPALIREAFGRTTLTEVAFPWWAMRLLSPFGGFPREATDILPLWRHPVQIDNARLVELLGAEPRTQPGLAMQTTLRGLGCLEDTASAQVASLLKD